MKKNCSKQIKKNLEKKKKTNSISNGNAMIIHLIAGLRKKHIVQNESPKPYRPFGGDINVKVDLSNYATKANLKKGTKVDTSNLALKSNLAKLKAKVEKIDVGKLKIAYTDLSKLNNVVDNEVFIKIVYDKLVAKVNNTDTSGFVLKTKYDTDKSNLEKKISDADKEMPNIKELVKKRL